MPGLPCSASFFHPDHGGSFYHNVITTPPCDRNSMGAQSPPHKLLVSEAVAPASTGYTVFHAPAFGTAMN